MPHFIAAAHSRSKNVVECRVKRGLNQQDAMFAVFAKEVRPHDTDYDNLVIKPVKFRDSSLDVSDLIQFSDAGDNPRLFLIHKKFQILDNCEPDTSLELSGAREDSTQIKPPIIGTLGFHKPTDEQYQLKVPARRLIGSCAGFSLELEGIPLPVIQGREIDVSGISVAIFELGNTEPTGAYNVTVSDDSGSDNRVGSFPSEWDPADPGNGSDTCMPGF